MLLKRLVIVSFLIFCTGNALAGETVNADENKSAASEKSPWTFEAGISAGRPTPLMIHAGIGYENVFFKAMGGAMYFGTDDFWVGYRGGFAWEFFRELPFTLDLGIGCGYAFAKAPNKYLKALNRANSDRLARSYNYKESFDISAEVRANIYGVFTYLAIPVHYFMKHDEPTVLWQVGYAYGF
jgi:hypothetical protein